MVSRKDARHAKKKKEQEGRTFVPPSPAQIIFMKPLCDLRDSARDHLFAIFAALREASLREASLREAFPRRCYPRAFFLRPP